MRERNYFRLYRHQTLTRIDRRPIVHGRALTQLGHLTFFDANNVLDVVLEDGVYRYAVFVLILNVGKLPDFVDSSISEKRFSNAKNNIIFYIL